MKKTTLASMAVVMIFLFLSGCAANGPRQPSPAANQEAALRTPLDLSPSPAPKTEGSLYSDTADANLFTDVRAHKVGDIVTITISESSKASKQAKTDLGRDSSLEAGLTALMGYENELGLHSAFQPSTALDTNFGSDFKGSGKTTRDESMTAQISARIIQVLPNGNLVVRGSREITVNNEKQYLVIQGVVRPQDISPENVLMSNYIADARIEYTGKGDVSSQQRKGWGLRAIDAVWPF